ncbi:MAG: radical SAM protein [Acidobacteriia bacterium]|nr:radical SAM protein [Terriglobia bacterium]
MRLEVTLNDHHNQHVIIHSKHDSISICLNHFNYSLNFDREGRLITVFQDGYTYQRSEENHFLVKWKTDKLGAPVTMRRALETQDIDEFLEKTRATVHDVFHALQQQKMRDLIAQRIPVSEAKNVQEWIQRILSSTRKIYEQRSLEFLKIYKPISILPPDQYRSLVIQGTEGCHYNRCTFCDFYKDRKFHVKTPAEFREHIRAIKEYYGQSLRLRRTLFLGDANAIVTPQETLLHFFEILNKEFEITPPGMEKEERTAWKAAHPIHFNGIVSFMDCFSSLQKSVEDFRQLASQNLKRVYIGVETGSDSLLSFLNKAGRTADIRTAIQRVKKADIAVGLIIMVGIGGLKFNAEHIEKTVQLLRALPLSERDLIYFSEFVQTPQMEYTRKALEEKVRSLTPAQTKSQLSLIRQQLKTSFPPIPAKLSVYDVRDFMY